MILAPEQVNKESLPMYLDRFLLKGHCRYGVVLSKNLEVLAIVDTKTKEETEVTMPQLQEYMDYITVVDKVRKLREIKKFEGNFVPQNCAVELRYDIPTDVMCVSKKEVVCDNTCCFFLLIHQDEHIVRGENEADAIIYTARPLDISGRFSIFSIGWDVGMDFKSRVNAHDLHTSIFESEGFKVQRWKIKDTTVDEGCRISAYDSVQLSMTKTVVRDCTIESHGSIQLNMSKSVVDGFFIVEAKTVKANIVSNSINQYLSVRADVLDLTINNLNCKNTIEIRNFSVSSEKLRNITIESTEATWVNIDSIGNLCLTMATSNNINSLRLGITSITDIETYSLDIGTAIYAIRVQVENPDLLEELLETPKFLELINELEPLGYHRIIDVGENGNTRHVKDWLKKNGLSKWTVYLV